MVDLVSGGVVFYRLARERGPGVGSLTEEAGGLLSLPEHANADAQVGQHRLPSLRWPVLPGHGHPRRHGLDRSPVAVAPFLVRDPDTHHRVRPAVPRIACQPPECLLACRPHGFDRRAVPVDRPGPPGQLHVPADELRVKNARAHHLPDGAQPGNARHRERVRVQASRKHRPIFSLVQAAP